MVFTKNMANSNALQPWRLITPAGDPVTVVDLKHFIRINPHLFDPRDLVWTHKPQGSWCRAYNSLARLRPGRRSTTAQWKQWRWNHDQSAPVLPADTSLSLKRIIVRHRNHPSAAPPPKIPDGVFLSVNEVASLLRIPCSSLYYLAQRGRVPAFRVGGRWRFLKADVLSILGLSDQVDAALVRAGLGDIVSRFTEISREIDKLLVKSRCA